MGTPTYHPAFPDSILHDTSLTSPTCHWTDFDDIEHDLRALSKKVINLMPTFQKTATKCAIDEELTHVKQHIMQDKYDVHQGVNVLLTYF